MPNNLALESHLNTGQPNHLNTRQIDAILFSYVFLCIQMVGLVDRIKPQTDHLNTKPFKL